jgi:lipoprotein-anchoring transpeptidase ErfK/SrfK
MGLTRWARNGGVALCVGLLVALSGCVPDSLSTGQATGTGSAIPGSSDTSLAVSVNPLHGSTSTWTDDPLRIAVQHGAVDSVQVRGPSGEEVPGTLSGSIWTPGRTYLPNTRYTVLVRVHEADEPTAATQYSFSFRTLVPKNTVNYRFEAEGSEVGIGSPLTVEFSGGITDLQARKDIEKALQVTEDPQQGGSWGWADEMHLMFRPAQYWQPGTKVTVMADLGGIRVGPDTYLTKDSSGSYTFEPDGRVVRVDEPSRTVTLLQGGSVVATMKMLNTPKPGGARSGVKPVMEKFLNFHLDSGQIGFASDSPTGWQLDVRYAQRLTWTGEFIHTVGTSGQDINAPQSGVTLSDSDAEELYEFTQIGTPVEYTALGDAKMYVYQGMGCWNMTYDQWKATSALP